ncbi:MAG: aspartate kinase [Candidatus Marinimicrobia bacterium]|nr:aspartate kinase [Candidatus Neomarinimicrobiota bacterium]
MKKIVVKFGGSNLRDKIGMKNIIQAVKQYNRPLVIVVSAFYGITNLLSEHLSVVLADGGKIQGLKDSLSQLKKEIIEDFISSETLQQKVIEETRIRLNQLERYLLGMHYIGDIPLFLEDLVLSYGERLSSLVLAAVLTDNGLECEEVFPEEMGLYTDGEFGNATVDFHLSDQQVSTRLKEDKIFVVPGFYGISPKNKVTLLGRGGSDYSAAAIAKCVNAASLDIWKDVNGFLSADPKIVHDPIKIKRLDYTEAAELAYFGAKILHPRTIEPLMFDNIPIRIFNINDTGRGIVPYSIIDNESDVSEQIIKSVTHSDDFGVLQLKGPGVGIKPGILAKVTGDFDDEKINIKTVLTAQTAINFLLDKKDLKKAYNHAKSLNLKAVNEIVVQDDITLIAAVGKGLAENHGIAARMFGALSEERINVQIICSGASSVATYFIIKKENKTRAIKAIHRAFFE